MLRTTCDLNLPKPRRCLPLILRRRRLDYENFARHDWKTAKTVSSFLRESTHKKSIQSSNNSFRTKSRFAPLTERLSAAMPMKLNLLFLVNTIRMVKTGGNGDRSLLSIPKIRFPKKIALDAAAEVIDASISVDASNSGSCQTYQDFTISRALDSYYYLFDSPPDRVVCAETRDETCVVETAPGNDEEFPCTRCDMTYPNSEFCMDYPCDTFECATTDAGESVRVCEQYTLSFNGNVYVNEGTCDSTIQQEVMTKHYTAGVTNFRTTSVIVKPQLASGQVVSYGCEVRIDDYHYCNSCYFCNSHEEGIFAADCSNIVSGAVVTCADPYSFDVLEKSASLVLEEGTTFPVELVTPRSTTPSSSGSSASKPAFTWMGAALSFGGVAVSLFWSLV